MTLTTIIPFSRLLATGWFREPGGGIVAAQRLVAAGGDHWSARVRGLQSCMMALPGWAAPTGYGNLAATNARHRGGVEQLDESPPTTDNAWGD